MELRHIGHHAELVREVVEQDVLHLYQGRHAKVVFRSGEGELQVPIHIIQRKR